MLRDGRDLSAGSRYTTHLTRCRKSAVFPPIDAVQGVVDTEVAAGSLLGRWREGGGEQE